MPRSVSPWLAFIVVVNFSTCGEPAETPSEKSYYDWGSQSSDAEAPLSDAELTELYGGIFEAGDFDISVSAETSPEIDQDIFETEMENSSAENYKDPGTIYFHIQDGAIQDGELPVEIVADETAFSLEIFVEDTTSIQSSSDKDSDSLVFTDSVVNANHLLLTLAGDGTVTIDSQDCVFLGTVVLELVSGNSVESPSNFIMLVTLENKDERTACKPLTYLSVEVSYRLERIGDNEEAADHIEGLWNEIHTPRRMVNYAKFGAITLSY